MSPHSAALLHQLRRLACPPPDAELLRRWSERRDEDAFAALVARHGRMVLGVCRRVLGNSHDAEDVFQATFLVLARKASTLRQPEALAGWLHGVALRLANKARTAAARRRAAGAQQASEPCDPQPEPLDLLSARELLALIDREIAGLPEVYRLPLVLCDLEERTQEEAAQLLGWTPGSLRGRLLRGRGRLQARLARRGLAPALLPALLASGLTRGRADAALASLAVRIAAGSASAPVPPAVAALARQGLRGLVPGRLKLVSALLLVATTLAAGTGLLARQVRALQAAPERSESAPPSPQADGPANPAGDGARVRRDASGDPLPGEALARLGTTRFRHGGRVESLGFTPDGKTLVSGGVGIVRVWDAVTGKEVRTLEPMASQHSTLSPDGKLLAVRRQRGSEQGPAIDLRDFSTGRLLRSFGDPQTPPQLLFSADGKVLAAFRWDKKIELWDPGRGRLLHALNGHEGIVWSVAFSADGKTLVSASDDETIRFWDVPTGKEVRRILCKERVYLVALSADGKLVASVSATRQVLGAVTTWEPHNRVRLWDASTGKELRQLAPPARVPAPRVADRLMLLAFSPDGRALLTGGIDGVLRFWDPASGRQIRSFSGFAGSPAAIAFAPDGKALAVAAATSVRRIDVSTGKDLTVWPGHSATVSSLAISPDGQTAATLSFDGPARLWSIRTGRLLRCPPAAADSSSESMLLPDAQTGVTLGPDWVVRIHDLATGKQLAACRGPEPGLHFALSPDRRTLAWEGSDRGIRLLDTATGKVRHTLSGGKQPLLGLAFSADGHTLAAWGLDRAVAIWDPVRGKKLRQLQCPPPAPEVARAYYPAALSADGKLFALGLLSEKGAAILVVDTATGSPVCRFRPTAYPASCLAFSPDGRSLAWGCQQDSRIHLGEIATGRLRHRFSEHRGCVTALTFSADGKTLLSGAEDTTALAWDLTGRLAGAANESKPLSGDDLKSHWSTLAGDDPSAAYRAIQALAADPRHALPFLEQQLRPVPVSLTDDSRIKQWIADLDSSDFAVRQRATTELDRQGQAALPALRKALEKEPSLEVRRRLEQLVRKHERSEWVLTAEQVRSSRALEVLERIGSPQAQRLLASLAGGMPEAWLTRQARAAVDRLANRTVAP